MIESTIRQVRVHLEPAEGHGVPLVSLSDGEGRRGLGELWPGEPEDLIEAVEAVSPILLGASCLSREAIWERVRSSTRDWEDTPEAISGTVAAVDEAVWDLGARALGVPAYVLMGGMCRTRVEVCAHCGRAEEPSTIEAAQQAVAQGVRLIGLDVSPAAEEGAMSLRRARRKLGGEVLIVARAQAPLASVEAAIQVGTEWDQAEPYWVEGLLRDGEWNELGQVRDRIASATSAGFSTWGSDRFWRPVVAGCADVITLGVDGAEGPTGVLKLADAIALRGLRAAVEARGGATAALAGAHAAMARGSVSVLRLRAAAVEALAAAGLVVDGYLRVPDAPGLGAAALMGEPGEPAAVFTED